MVKYYYTLLPTRKITKVLCPCFNTKRGISSNFEEDHPPPRRRYRGPKSWSFLFIPLLIMYLVFYKYQYQTSWSSPKKQTTRDRQVTHKVDMVIRQTKVEETTAMRLLGLADLELKRNGTAMTNTPFILTNGLIKYPIYMEPPEKANGSSVDIGQNRTCYYNHTGLGRVTINRTILSLQWVDNLYPMVRRGGYYKPRSCQPRHKVAILVPYMNSPDNLASFLFNIHPFLMSQKIEYRIFVIEQHDQNVPINKRRLYNAGFIEAQKLDSWKCIIFHEVDLLPLDHSILYTCNILPRHMSATVKERDPSKSSLFGGVTSLTPEQFIEVNGYSNDLYLGGNDNYMFWRLRYAGFSISRYDKSIAQYTELSHRPMKVVGVQAVQLPKKSNKKKGGLEELNYIMLNMVLHHLYTLILVDVNLE